MASTELRAAAQQALEALELAYAGADVITVHGKAITALRAALTEPVQEPVKLWPLAPLTGYYDVGGKRVWLEKDEPFPQPAPPQRPAEPVQEPVAGVVLNEEGRAALVEHGREEWHCVVRNARRLYAAPPQPAEPLTVERLRDALVASRIVPPAAVEDPDEYDDGVTLYRIEALHRRLA